MQNNVFMQDTTQDEDTQHISQVEKAVCVEFVFFFLLRYFFHKMSSAPQSTIIQTSKHDTAIFWCWLQLHHTVKK